MISSFAAAVRAPWTVALIIFVGAETLEIGKNCPKWKRWILSCGKWLHHNVAYHHSQVTTGTPHPQ